MQLPDRPNFRHLRDQAKALVRSGTVATLAAAQFQIARQYGYLSWPKLKRHVDRLEAANQVKQAIAGGDLGRVQALMTANPNLHRGARGDGKETPLTWATDGRDAASSQRLAIAQWLIDHGSDVHQNGDAPLACCAREQSIPMMELLVRNGADVNGVWMGWVPVLFVPCEKLDSIAIQWLLNHGADPNRGRPAATDTALDYVIQTSARDPYRLTSCVDALLAAGAHTRYDLPGVLPILRGRTEELAALIDANPTLLHRRYPELDCGQSGGRMLTLRGATLLHVAAEFGFLDSARLLLDRGADVNARARTDLQGVGGQTAIFHALTNDAARDSAVGRLLIDRGADLGLRARVPGHHERPTEVLDISATQYGSLFPLGKPGATEIIDAWRKDAAPRKARIEGIVVTAAEEPVGGAAIQLMELSSGRRNPRTRRPLYDAISGERGEFVIEYIEPGSQFKLTAKMAGFLDTNFGSRKAQGPRGTLRLAAGESLRALRLVLTPESVISGRVTDANGEPQPEATVVVMRQGYWGGPRELVSVTSAKTNDQGSFQIADLGGGRYCLHALPRYSTVSGGGTEVPIQTYYPNATDPEAAAWLDLAAGQELKGIEIPLRQGRVFSVGGKVVDSAGAPLKAFVTILPKGLNHLNLLHRASTKQNAWDTQANADGLFVMGNLTPGSYSVQCAMEPGLAFLAEPSEEIAIVDQDLSDLVFRVDRRVSATGTVRLEGGDLEALLPPPSSSSEITNKLPRGLRDGVAMMTVGVSNAGGQMPGRRLAVGLTRPSRSSVQLAAAAAELKPDGTFVIDDVATGTYHFSVGAVPEDLYVKMVRVDGVDVTHRPVQLGASGGTIEVLLAKNAAAVAGRIADAKGEPQSGVMLSMWTAEEDIGRIDRGVRTTTTDATGAFRIGQLPPGSYFVAAWDDVDEGLARFRDFVTLMTGHAKRVELKEGDRPSPQLELIPAAITKAAEETLR